MALRRQQVFDPEAQTRRARSAHLATSRFGVLEIWRCWERKTGFTLIELIVVLGMLATLTGLSYLTLFGRIQQTDVTSVVVSLIADLRSQQVRAISGEQVNGIGSYGVHLDANQYVIFSGSTYSANDPGNTAFPTSGAQLSTTFAGGNVVFSPGSGEIAGFSSSANAITVTSLEGGSTKTIRLNRYGVVANEE